MAPGSTEVIKRSLPGAVERVALFLVEQGHDPDPAVAMACNLMEARLPHDIRRWRHLTATPDERLDLARTLQARRVLVEGVMLGLEGEVREGAVLSAHALCESRTAQRRMRLQMGGAPARYQEVKDARARLVREIGELDKCVEAAVATSDDLSRDDKSADPNPRVVHLQNRLNSLGFRVQPDGVFGPVTEESIKDMQAKAGLDTSGVVDAATRDALRHGGKPSWVVNTPPGLAPTSGPPPLTPPAADRQDVNKETDSDAAPARPDSASSSDPGKTTAKSEGGKSVSVNVKLKEGAFVAIAERLEEAREARDAAAAAGDGMGVRVATARMGVFRRHLEEAIGPIDKGAFHRWLGKPDDEPITDADIARGIAAGGHPAKMARFAKAARGFKHAREAVADVLDPHGTNGDLRRLMEDWASYDAKRHLHPGDLQRMPVGVAHPLAAPGGLQTPGQHGHVLRHAGGYRVVQRHAHSDESRSFERPEDAIAHINRLGFEPVAGHLREADGKADYPATCMVCGAKVKKGVCQRGHSQRKLMEATERQLVEEGLLLEEHYLQEDWARYDAERKLHGVKTKFKDGDVMHPDDLKVGHQFYYPGSGPSEITGDKGDKWKIQDLDDLSSPEFEFGKGEMYKPQKARTSDDVRGMTYLGTRGAADDVRKRSKLQEARDSSAGDEHRNVKCPKCDTVQSATHKTCSKCGHDLAEARKAKFAQEAKSSRFDDMEESELRKAIAKYKAMGDNAPAAALVSANQALARKLSESKLTPVLSTKHAPIGKGGKNWITRTEPGNRGQLPAYIQNIRNAIMRDGKSEGHATALAVSAVKRWAAGLGGVTATVKAAAAKAVAEWEALKAKSKAVGAAKATS